MAYKSSFYYDEFDYGDYQELDYDTYDEPSPTASDIFNCGVSVSKQIALQLLSLLCVNFVYRVIRQASEYSWFALLISRLISDILDLPDFIKHLSSSLLGYFSTFIFFTTGNFFVCLLVFASFGFLKLLQLTGVKKQGFLVTAFQIALIFTWWVLTFVNDSHSCWHKDSLLVNSSSLTVTTGTLFAVPLW